MRLTLAATFRLPLLAVFACSGAPHPASSGPEHVEQDPTAVISTTPAPTAEAPSPAAEDPLALGPAIGTGGALAWRFDLPQSHMGGLAIVRLSGERLLAYPPPHERYGTGSVMFLLESGQATQQRLALSTHGYLHAAPDGAGGAWLVAARSVPDPDVPELSDSPTIAELRIPRTIAQGHFLAHVDGQGKERRVWAFPEGLSVRHVTIDPDGSPWVTGALREGRALPKLAASKEARTVFVKVSKQGAVLAAVPLEFSQYPPYPAFGGASARFAHRGPKDAAYRIADDKGAFGSVTIPELMSSAFVGSDGGVRAISGVLFHDGAANSEPFVYEEVDLVSWDGSGKELFRKRVARPASGSLGEVLLDVDAAGSAALAAPFFGPDPMGILVTELSGTGAHLYSSRLPLHIRCSVFSFWPASVVLTDDHLVIAADCPSMDPEDGSEVPPRTSVAAFRRR